MGNSCCSVPLSMPAIICKAEKSCKSSNIAVVVAGESYRMVEVEVPPPQTSMKVAELLLEFPPGHFIACFDPSYFVRPADINNVDSAHHHVRPAARISALAADTDAVPGEAHVYVLFPMPRLHTRMTPQERLTFAQLLHKVSASAAGQYSRTKPFSSAWRLFRRRGARVAPMQMPSYGAMDITSNMQILDANEASSAHEQGNMLIHTMMLPRRVQLLRRVPGTSSIDDQSHQMMQMKPKPWAPSLEAIWEEQPQCQ